MGRQGIEVEVEAIAGEDREAVGCQVLPQGMDHVMGSILSARTEVEHRDQLAERVNDDPEPQHVGAVTQPRAEFIQLEVGQVQLLQPAVMQASTMLPGTRDPARNRLLGVAEHAASSRDTQPFRKHREHEAHLLRGGFQAIESRMPPGTEGAAARLTAKGLDPLGLAMGATPTKAWIRASVIR